MRTWMLAALTLFAVGLIDARPASAAWSCVGPEYVCGSAPSAKATSSKSSYKKSAYSGDERPARASRKAKAKTTATASSWWGEEPAAPARRAKSRGKQVASASFYGSDEPAPRARKQQRRSRSVASDSDSGGSYSQGGMASYYWQPQRVASGGWFNPNAMTAAHKTLPFGTKVRVTNKRNGQSVVVTINDRGPYVAGRVIDLSSAAAGAINMKGAGVVPVSVAVLGR